MNYQDPEWTEPDGTERGSGAIMWLAVVAIVALTLAAVTFWVWL
jgi:hypothetical protein